MTDFTLMSIRKGESTTSAKVSLRSRVSIEGKASELLGASLSLGNHVFLKNAVVTGILLLLVLLSAVGVVYSSHLSRQLFSEQAILLEKNDQLQLEWAQLLLEQSAWSSPTRVETVARDQLGMVMPEAAQIELIY